MQIIKKALTFDDVLLVPRFSDIIPDDIILKTNLTRKITLNIPLISAAMDTVTESKLAISMAQQGGIGFIHKNLSPEKQAEEVLKVKRFESGVVNDPITVQSSIKVHEAIALSKENNISGFPVLDGLKLIGIVTNRDLRFETKLNEPIYNIMTPKKSLITVKEGTSLYEAQKLMHKHKLERVLVVNDLFELRGLMTVKDITKQKENPISCKDKYGKLRVGAAIGTINIDSEERVNRLYKSGVDVIIIDTAHGHSKRSLDSIKWMKRNYPEIEIISGNIATEDAAKMLIKHDVDAIKIGIGPGSICTTRIIAGVGVPQFTAILNVFNAVKNTGIPIIADGGIRYSGDIAKALAAGANTVMIGGIFAGTKESPGNLFIYQGRQYKSYRGMGSIGAMQDGSADRYFQDSSVNINNFIPEGIEGRVAYKGSISKVLFQLIGGLRSSMIYCGCCTIKELHKNAIFVEITDSGMRESHVHNVQIIKEAPNYHIDKISD